ncbi:MAG: hypothetical protein KIT69_06900 [Propionibacteriaceae bacterium]|nr:hypothetical protein [Propionibacteriaceae bacterium]
MQWPRLPWQNNNSEPDPQVVAAGRALLDLTEAYDEIQAQLAADQRGWSLLPSQTRGFSHEILTTQAEKAELMATINPLIKRGLNLIAAYVWGQGVNVTVRDEATEGQDVQSVLTRFWDDELNRCLTTPEGQVELERNHGTCGENWLALPTDQRTGEVWVRPLPAREITAILTDPEDSETDWFYLRSYTIGKTPHRTLYPALGYRPLVRPKKFDKQWYDKLEHADLDGVEIRWDSPVRKVQVNRLGDRGIGDAFASIPWAIAYKEILEAWHKLILSLARFVWQAKSGRADKAREVAQQILNAEQQGKTGGTVVTDPTSRIEAISKSGATFDADSGRAVATIVSAGLNVPVTMLLGDPGIAGNRATAETLNEPSQLIFGLRRQVWTGVFRDIAGYVIDSAVRAGVLKGTVLRRGDREIIRLPEDDTRTIVTDWPDYDSTPVKDAVEAILTAQTSQTLPPLTILRLLLKALKVDDADEILDQMTDDHGEFVPLDVADARVRGRLTDRGETA